MKDRVTHSGPAPSLYYDSGHCIEHRRRDCVACAVKLQATDGERKPSAKDLALTPEIRHALDVDGRIRVVDARWSGGFVDPDDLKWAIEVGALKTVRVRNFGFAELPVKPVSQAPANTLTLGQARAQVQTLREQRAILLKALNEVRTTSDLRGRDGRATRRLQQINEIVDHVTRQVKP